MRNPTIRAAWALLALAAICTACTQGKITTDPLGGATVPQVARVVAR